MGVAAVEADIDAPAEEARSHTMTTFNAREALDQYGEMTLAMAQSQMFAAMSTVKKKDVAKRLGVTPPYVSSLFKGDTDLTMRQFGRVLAAAGFEARLWLVPIPKATRTRRPR